MASAGRAGTKQAVCRPPYQQPVRASGLHHHFRQLTGMSPLQYQKWLRLNEARRLMLSEGADAATAGFSVGYESPSQFSREYARLYGAPPAAEAEAPRGRGAALQAANGRSAFSGTCSSSRPAKASSRYSTVTRTRGATSARCGYCSVIS